MDTFAALAIVASIILIAATAGIIYYYSGENNDIDETPSQVVSEPSAPVCPNVTLGPAELSQINPRWEGAEKYVDAKLICPVTVGSQYGEFYDPMFATSYNIANSGCDAGAKLAATEVTLSAPVSGLPSKFAASKCGTIVGKVKVGEALPADPSQPGTCGMKSFIAGIGPITDPLAYDCGSYVNADQCKSMNNCIWTPEAVTYEDVDVIYSAGQRWPDIGHFMMGSDKIYDCHNLAKEGADYLKNRANILYPGTLRPYNSTSQSGYFRDNGTGISCGMSYTGAPGKVNIAFVPSAADGYKYKAVDHTFVAGTYTPDWLGLLRQYAPGLV